jgi:hypothetical protein
MPPCRRHPSIHRSAEPAKLAGNAAMTMRLARHPAGYIAATFAGQ